MLHASRRKWRLFYLAPLLALSVVRIESQAPTLTTVSDTVYRPDGIPAAGVLLISWPAFATASGATVAAGNRSVTLGANGSMTVQLARNAGATPAGSVYTVGISTYRRYCEN